MATAADGQPVEREQTHIIPSSLGYGQLQLVESKLARAQQSDCQGRQQRHLAAGTHDEISTAGHVALTGRIVNLLRVPLRSVVTVDRLPLLTRSPRMLLAFVRLCGQSIDRLPRDDIPNPLQRPHVAPPIFPG